MKVFHLIFDRIKGKPADSHFEAKVSCGCGKIHTVRLSKLGDFDYRCGGKDYISDPHKRAERQKLMGEKLEERQRRIAALGGSKE